MKSKFPEKSFVASAYKYDVPIYVSTLKDSSLALNLAVHRLRDKTYNLDFVREIIEQGAIVHAAKKSGIVELGRSPKIQHSKQVLYLIRYLEEVTEVVTLYK